MILPVQEFSGNSKGEKYVWELFKEYLPKDFVSFHNYYLTLRQADIIMLVPSRGVLIVEIKGYKAKNIIKAPDNNYIQIVDSTPIPSPFKQAIEYRNIFINDYLNENNIKNVYVGCVVCYPFVNREEFSEKQLDKISPQELTITSEDFQTSEHLVNKISSIFDFIDKNRPSNYKFDNSFIDIIGNLISPNFRDCYILSDQVKSENKTDFKADSIKSVVETSINTKEIARNYSLFYYYKAGEVLKFSIDDLISLWLKGTKIFFYSDDVGILDNLKNKLKTIIAERKQEKVFGFNSSGTFLFSLDKAPTFANSFCILNGVGAGNYSKEFETLHECSSFNKDQYLIEHAKENEDIIVKAGAGTGKTFSIMSRINYLVWKKDYEPVGLKNAVSMITFTRDSADAMKKKITENFLKYNLLTRDSAYLDYIEVIEEMNILTIHSMAKNLLQQFAFQLGLGKDFKIASSVYDIRRFLQKNLNHVIENNPNFVDKLNLSVYDLTKRLIELIGKFDNKNIDLLTNNKNLNYGNETINSDFKYIIDVIKNTQKDLGEYNAKNNAVQLSDLIRKLDILSVDLSGENSSNNNLNQKIDFLFVDEFQDTDDSQIELMVAFKKLLNFNFFVVGDIKQCIYRFRGAEVLAFDTLKQLDGSSFTEFSLNKNYRTYASLMDSLNDIFIKWDSEQIINYKKFNGDVLSSSLEKNYKAEINEFSYRSNLDFENELIKIANECKEEKEVAILVRYNWQIEKIKNVFAKYGQTVKTDVGGDLYKIEPTIDLYKLVLALKYNTSPKYLCNLYTTSYIKEPLLKTELFNINNEEIKSYFNTNILNALDNWDEYLKRLKDEPILKVLRDIIDDTNPWNNYANNFEYEEHSDPEINKKIKAERVAYYAKNLDQLFEILIETSNTDYLTLNKVCNFLELMITTKREAESRISTQSKTNIICTTVHKSKGLEYDVVVLPYCDDDISWKREKGKVDLIYSRTMTSTGTVYEIGYQIKDDKFNNCFKNDIYEKYLNTEKRDRRQEEARILYVALTRAKKRIVHFTDLGENHDKSWRNLIKGKFN